MHPTDKHVLGCVFGTKNVLDGWRAVRSNIPHPCVFSSTDSLTLAICLEYAAERHTTMSQQGFYNLLGRVPYWQFREILREVERGISKTEDVGFGLVRKIIANHTSLADGDPDLDDTMSVLEHANGNEDFVNAVLHAPMRYDAQELAGILMRQYAKRRATILADELIKASEADDFDPGRWAERCRTCLAGTITTQSDGEDVGAGLSTFNPEEAKGDRQTLITGMDGLDKELITYPGSFIVVSAPQGYGKSAFMWQSAVETAANLDGNVLYYSFEMSKQQHYERLHLRVGDHRLDDVAASILGKLALVDNTAGAMSVEGIIADIKRRHLNDPTLRVVFIDYLGLIKRSLRDTAGLSEQVGHITTNLKLLAGQLGLTIVTAAQQTREGRKEIRGKDGQVTAIPQPRVSDLYGGTYIESDASHVIFLWPQMDDVTEDRLGTKVVVAKHRDGPRFVRDAAFYPGRQLITEARNGYLSHIEDAEEENWRRYGS